MPAPANNPHDVVIVEAIRTASGRGRPDGALADTHPVDLLAQTISGLFGRVAVDPGDVDDVIIGCVSQVGEQSATPGRIAWLGAGLPAHVPATTIDRKCGSGQQAVHFAAQGIRSGEYEIVVAGGVESMSRVRMGSARMDADPYGSMVAQRFAPGLVSQGVAAELVAAKWGLTRAALDEYSAESHRRAAFTEDSGGFAREIIGIGSFDSDESIRPGTTAERLAGLKTVFETDQLSHRFPEISWSITAGNSSQITDGASVLLITSRAAADRLGLRPRARIHTMFACGDDPMLMLTAPIPATHQTLKRSGLALTDIDHIEINEAFAPYRWPGSPSSMPTRRE